jgi:predicted transcriptional regulator
MSDADFDLIERFVTAFNGVDRYLRDLYHIDDRISFGRLVEIHLRKNSHWRDADSLRAFKAVRNVMVHERELPYRYLFVPTRSAVEEMERIRDRLTRPERMIPKFRRRVWTIGAGDSAARLFVLINEHRCSKFPVYEGAKFCGLLTEIGVTRWMAREGVAQGAKIDLAEIAVGKILSEEEDSRNVDFLAAEASTDDLLRHFSVNPDLQAVLVTQNGTADEPLAGIATRGDALRLLGSSR